MTYTETAATLTRKKPSTNLRRQVEGQNDSNSYEHQRIPRHSDFVITPKGIQNPRIKPKESSKLCFYFAIAFCLVNIGIVIVAILTFSGVLDLPILEKPCRLKYKFHEPDYNLEYKFSYCERGNFCESIINLEDHREVITPSCRYDELYETDQNHIQTYSYLDDFLDLRNLIDPKDLKVGGNDKLIKVYERKY